jgi:hypothetical protein
LAKLKSFDLYPYSGWEELPWNEGRGSIGPWGDMTLDQDAAARTSRRVFEAVSWGVKALGIDSRRSSYRLGILDSYTEPGEFDVRPNLKYFADGFVGHVAIPQGFRFVEPDERASLLLGALSAVVEALSTREGWDFAPVESVIAGFRDSGYACEWASPQKMSRDRMVQVQMVARLADDGYGRWHLVVSDVGTGKVLIRSAEVLGWTWVENFVRSFKSMRFIAPRVVEVGSGSGILDRTVNVNLETGEVIREMPEPVPLSYPGDPTGVETTPTLVVRHQQ